VTWRDRFPLGDVESVPFSRDVLLRLTGVGVRAISDHARRMGMTRTAWIRHAIREQMLAEGAAYVPDLAPHTGGSMREMVEHGRR